MPAIDPALFTTSIDATAFPLEGRCGPAAAGKNAGLERFVYDCTEDLGRRKSPVPLLRGEDDELPMYRRMQVVTLGRDIRRNFAVAAWAIRRHLDYVARFRFRSTTGDEKIDARVNDLIDWCSKPWNFDAARRHSRRKFTRLVEASRCVDGDVLTVKRTSGRLQAIEGDRIRTPLNYGKAVRPLSAETLRKMKFGVVTDDNGAALAYAVNRRGPEVRVGPDLIVPANSFIFERLVPARHAIHVAYFDRFDQTRGISPVAAALNQFRDIYEGFDYALAQAKVAQLFALVIKRGSPEALDEFQTRLSKGGKLTDYKDQIDFKRGPCMLDLDPQDAAEFMQSNNPSANWQAFMNMVIAAALKALDIPYSFYDESHTNYSGSRGAWLMYDQASDDKREDLREFLDRWCSWRLGLLIFQNVLELPRGFGPERLSWQWIARKVPWIDPLKEIQASKAEVDAGFNSTVGVAESLGLDAYELADQQAAYLAYRAKLGLPPPGTLQPIPVTYGPEAA